MNRRLVLIALLSSLLPAATDGLSAQSVAHAASTGSLVGRVLNSNARSPLDGAQIFIPSLNQGTLVRADGRYEIADVPPGRYEVRAQHLGYQTRAGTVTVTVGGTAILDFELAEDAIAIDGFIVTNSASLRTTLPVRPVSGVFGFDVLVKDAPRTVFQINPQQVENDLISSVSDLARYTPSVNQTTGNLENYGTPNLRGAQGDAYQNGVRLITRPGNNRPFTTNAYEGADIVAGPAPILFGPSARTAGYINYVTKKPFFDRQHATASWSGGKWYADGTGFEPHNTVQLDVGGPIVANRLAYRLSYEGADRHFYYDDRGSRYNQVFGSLGWLPDGRSAVDFNFEVGRFKWDTNNFQNRVTNELIRDRTYLGGPSTPIVQVGSAFYSPVLNANGTVTGWITRTRVVNADGTNGFRPGTAVADPTGPTTARAGTIVGYVLDPTIVKPVELSDRVGLNAPGFLSTTTAVNGQLRAKRSVTSDLTLLNNATYQYYETNNPSNGGFHNWIRAQVFEDRAEAQLKKRFGALTHESNSGLSYRWEPNKNYKDGQRAGYGPSGDQYDLTAPATSFTRNAFFGATVYPFFGTVNDPVLTRFGYLKGFWGYLEVPDSPGDYNTPGGTGSTDVGTLASQTYDTSLRTFSAFSQHRFDIGRVALEAGARWSKLWAHIRNPLSSPLVAGNADIEDSIDDSNFNLSTSLTYRPVDAVTLYYAFAHVEAVNGNTSGAVAWPRTTLDRDRGDNKFSRRDFNSTSRLQELGAKLELAGRLFFTGTLYEQTRVLTLTLPAGFTEPEDALGLYRGVELGVRYQPARAAFAGVNYTYIDAEVQHSTYSNAAPIVADNFTNVLSSTTAIAKDYRVSNLPRHAATAFANYELRGGLGFRGDLAIRSEANVDNGGTITIPASAAGNVGAYFNRSRYRVSLDVQNVTDANRRAGGNAPLEPFSVQARIVYRY